MSTTTVQEHTPGPWRAVSRSSGVEPTDDYDDDFLGWEIEGPPEAQRGQFARAADARLIAAAPDLFAALIHLLGVCELTWRIDEEDEGPNPDLALARAAIAKATGVQA